MQFRHLMPSNRIRASVAPYTGDGEPPFQALHQRVDRLFDDFLRGFDLAPFAATTRPEGASWMPSLDFSETSEEYRVNMELPGVDAKDVDVALREGVLVIRGEKQTEERQEEENVYHLERCYGRFERAVRLPGEVDADRIDASYDKGVLTVRLPKVEQAKESVRRIEVKAR